MNWNYVLWAGVGGAVGGGVGAAIVALFSVKSTQIKQALLVVPAVILPVIMPKLMAHHPLLPLTSSEREAQMFEGAIRQSPAFAELLRGKSDAQVQVLTQQKTHAGLKRLSFEDLVSWNRVRLRLAERNTILCAGLWTGRGLTGRLITETLDQLDRADVDAFMGVSMRAAIAEVENRPFPAPPATIADALTRIKEGLPAADAERFDRSLAQGLNAAPEDACWTFKELLRGYARLPSGEQESFLRFLAAA